MSSDNEDLEPDYNALKGQVKSLGEKINNLIIYQNEIASKDNIYQDVLDAVPAFIFWKDKSNNILGFNLAYQKAVNISKEDLLSKTGFELFPEAQKYWEDDLEVMNTGVAKLNIIEDVIIPPNIKIWFKTDKVPLKDSEGKIIGVIGVSIDITELKNTQDDLFKTNLDLAKSQEELKVLNSNLDIKIKEKTQDLLIANKNLKILNADLDNFIYLASHDLKHPIVMMEGILNRLKKGNLPNETETTFLNHLNTSVIKLKSIIEELGEIIKVQHNIDAETEEVDFMTLFEDVKFSLSDLIKENNPISFEIDFSNCESINFSRKYLRSIFYNIISNSIKYQSEKRNSYIKICTRNLKDFMMIEFKDNGIGIKEEHKEKVFQMFKRFQTKGGGSGLGLYIVKRIVDNYNGKITLKSIPEEETTFEIFLPVKENL
jgi:PAS domain S-box-containing protein